MLYSERAPRDEALGAAVWAEGKLRTKDQNSICAPKMRAAARALLHTGNRRGAEYAPAEPVTFTIFLPAHAPAPHRGHCA